MEPTPNISKQPEDVNRQTAQELKPAESRAHRMTSYLNSSGYLENLTQFDRNHRQEIIGHTLEYFILHPDGKDIDEYVQALRKIKFGDNGTATAISQLLSSSIVRRLGFGEPLTDEQQQQVYDYYVRNVVTDGVYYHGFNSVFENSIRKQGLSPEIREWDENDLEKVRAIGNKRGSSMLLGWRDINSKGTTSLAATPINAYRYAVASPEWFAQFTSEGFHIPNEPANKEAYYRGDYATARANIEKLCQNWQSSREEDIQSKRAYPNITDGEKEEVLAFFEKYWHKFRAENQKPLLALVDRTHLDGVAHPETYEEIKKIYEGKNLFEIIDFLRRHDDQGVDIQTKKNIPPERVEIVELPNYDKVFPK